MIKSYLGRATEVFATSGKSKFSGLDEALADQRLAELNAAPSLSALSPLASVGLHKLTGDLRGFFSMDINGRWRLLFRFRDGNAHDVHIADTHR